MKQSELAKQIYELSYITGEFRLSSGQISDRYFDKYLFEGQPEILHAVVARMILDLFAIGDIDAIAGLEMGGIPIATIMSQRTGLPTLFVRKERKEHGTCKLIEGGKIEGQRVAVIEDIVTSGGHIVGAVDQLRATGAIVRDALCVIDRESGGRANLREVGLRLYALFTMSELERSVEEDDGRKRSKDPKRFA